MVYKKFLNDTCRQRCRLKKHSLQVRHKQEWSRELNILLTQAAVLSGSDAGSDFVEPVS